MNILHISAQRPDSTGSGVYLNETVNALWRQGHHQAVVAGVTLTDRSPFDSEILFAPVHFGGDDLPFPVVGMSDVMPYPSTRYRDLTPKMVAQFKAAFTETFDNVFAQFSPDIVICHHLYLACSVLAQWFENHPAERARCSFRAVCHNTDLRQYESHGLEREAINRAVRSLDVAFALHEQQADEIVELHGVRREAIRVTGTGYNDRMFFPDLRKRTSATQQLVYVGKLWKQKGLMELFDALNLLPAEIADGLSLLLVGGYSNQAERDEIVARAQSCQVACTFAGQVSQAGLIEAYQQSSVFVLPSFSEGLPLVAIEALACGCKVVMTDLPGTRAWFNQSVPHAPIWYVEMPPLAFDDAWHIATGDARTRFSHQLAHAIEEALAADEQPCNMSELSWGSLAKRLIAS